MIDVSNELIHLYMLCKRCERLLWLLNKTYLQIITELENVKEISLIYNNDSSQLILSKVDKH